MYWYIPDTLNNIILIYVSSNYDHKVNFKKEYKANAVIHYYLYKGLNHWTGCVMLIFLMNFGVCWTLLFPLGMSISNFCSEHAFK